MITSLTLYEENEDISNELAELMAEIASEVLLPTVSCAKVGTKKSIKRNSNQKSSLNRRVRTDIRESYPLMLINALNTSNFTIIERFFRDFSDLDVKCCMKRFIPHQNTTFVKEYWGPFAITNLLYTSVALAPDSLLKLQSSSFHSDAPNSPVLFTMDFAMTKVYNVASIHEVLPNMTIDRTVDGKHVSDSEINETVVTETVESLKNVVPLRKKPVSCSYELKLLLQTNPLTKVCTQIGITVEQKSGSCSTES